MAKDALFCVSQKAFIKKDEEILLLMDPLVGLDFPGGKIQEGEIDFEEALRREVEEETGLAIEVGEPFFTWYYNRFPFEHRNYGKKVFLVGLKCRYLSGDIKTSEEHNKYRWVNKNNYRELKGKMIDSGYFSALEKYFE